MLNPNHSQWPRLLIGSRSNSNCWPISITITLFWAEYLWLHGLLGVEFWFHPSQDPFCLFPIIFISFNHQITFWYLHMFYFILLFFFCACGVGCPPLHPNFYLEEGEETMASPPSFSFSLMWVGAIQLLRIRWQNASKEKRPSSSFGWSCPLRHLGRSFPRWCATSLAATGRAK